MTAEQQSSDVAIPPGSATIELHIGELRQLFNSMDPAPFRDRDLDPKAEEFIVEWGQEQSFNLPLALIVHLDRRDSTFAESSVLGQSVREFFTARALATRQKLHQLLGIGRISLAIGLAFLGASIVLGDLIFALLSSERLGGILQESLLIGGWVAMWRPIEIFLYDWWPIRAEAKLYDRLGAMTVRIMHDTSDVTSPTV